MFQRGVDVDTVKEQNGIKVMFQYKELIKIWIGQLVSRMGDSIDAIAYMWMIYKLTGSSLLMSTIMIFNVLPSLLFGFFAGVIVDRWQRKRIMIAGDIIRGVVVSTTAALFLLNMLKPWYLFIFSFINSLAEVFVSPSRSGTIPLMVKEKHLMQANAIFSLSSSIAEIFGYAFASVIVATWGIFYGMVIDALTFFFSSFCVMAAKIPELKIEKRTLNLSGFINDLKDGLFTIKNARIVIILSILSIIANFSVAPFNVLQPIYSDKILHAGSKGFAITSVAFSVGILISSLFISQFGSKVKKYYLISIGIICFGISYAMLAIARNLTIAAVLFLIMGFSFPVISIPINTIIQMVIPKEKLGRVLSAFATSSLAAMPLGLLTGGILVKYINVNIVFMILGMLLLTAGITLYLNKAITKEFGLLEALKEGK